MSYEAWLDRAESRKSFVSARLRTNPLPSSGEASRVTAEAKVENIVIAGEFQGNVTAYNSLQILKTGNFAGNITCKSLSLEAGGKLNGNVRPLEAQDGVFPLSDAQAAPASND